MERKRIIDEEFKISSTNTYVIDRKQVEEIEGCFTIIGEPKEIALIKDDEAIEIATECLWKEYHYSEIGIIEVNFYKDKIDVLVRIVIRDEE